MRYAAVTLLQPSLLAVLKIDMLYAAIASLQTPALVQFHLKVQYQLGLGYVGREGILSRVGKEIGGEGWERIDHEF